MQKRSMSRLYVVCLAILAAAGYLTFTFILMEPNPTLWKEVHRTNLSIFIWLSAVISLFIAGCLTHGGGEE